MKRVDALEKAIDKQIKVHAELLVVALDDVEKNVKAIRAALAKPGRVNVFEHLHLMREAVEIAYGADDVLSVVRGINSNADELKRIPKRR